MKILLVSHGYPPQARGGTENYTADLARALARRGHQACVLAARKEITLPDLTWRESQRDGVQVAELVNNLFFERFEQTWEHPRIEELFAARLARCAPEVVHFQHLLSWSLGCVELAARSGARVYFTLHDYWLGCPRFGQRRHADGTLCARVDFERCGTCLPSLKFAQTPLQRGTARALAGLRRWSGVDLGPLARRTASTGGAAGFPEPDPARAARFASATRARAQGVRTRVLPFVRRFLAPSEFLRQRFLEDWAGALEPERVRHLPFGLELPPAPPRRARAGDEPLRVVFLGSLIRVKGAGLLLEAWSRLAPELRARATLEIHGPRGFEPEFQRELDALAARSLARILGPCAREEVPALLVDADLLVVPSLWWENAPLVIHEARALGTPLLVADAGGMAELVEPGVDGWRFALGDVEALRARLAELLARPELLRALPRRPRPALTLEEHLAELEAEYAR